ncbi:hypothetical protein H4S07_001496 [Coemansia furcata]|uniref:Uncharacterized protein n=1 Tax=Coemansia furcata TaxID=417177 RepID=A0ACC1LNI8_9FUNG|nr:hypothetical protein H4S07_001496 [Coemansia furcata]
MLIKGYGVRRLAVVATNLVTAATVFSTLALAKGACDSPIYCQGDLLHAVQMAKLFPDDKTFVDKPTLKPPTQVLANFAQIGGANASRDDLAKFVGENFGQEGSELKPVDLTELDANPPFLNNVSNPILRAFGQTVNGYWSTLIREQDYSVLCDGCVSSMLSLKYHFVVPGGRFRETYYWDTYFTIEGMLRSGLKDMTRSNIRDLLALVDFHGFVPNGARVYYLDRSQPPMLTLMVKLYYEHTGDAAFVAEALPLLQKEHAYWQANHSVNVTKPDDSGIVQLSRYIVDTDQPRPESYTTDYDLAHNATTDPAAQAGIYADMATGAESGWDYSTRWVKNPSAPIDRLLYGIRTRQVIPVELNAILYQVENTLADFVTIANCSSSPTATDYKELAQARRNAMYAMFYDQPSGLFFDYFLDERQRSTILSPAALWPYWSFGPEETSASHDGGSWAKTAFSPVSRILGKSPGGFPATLYNSGQQWDYPSVWPPLQYVLMQAALTTGHADLAAQLAQKFVESVFCAWYNTGGSIPGMLEKLPNTTDSGHMFEKFDSTQIGKEGGGGEYTVQAGFGWTNGVLIWTLDMFGKSLAPPACPGTPLGAGVATTASATPNSGSSTSTPPLPSSSSPPAIMTTSAS